MDILPMKNCAY